MKRVSARPCAAEKSMIIRNLYPLYDYDLSQFEEGSINEFGILGSSQAASWEEKTRPLDIWWEDTAQRFPYVIYEDETPVGFCLVARPTTPSEGIDNYLVEFFVERKHRNSGIGRMAAKEIIGKYDGMWTLRVLPGNAAAWAFWRNTIAEMGKCVDYKEYIDEDNMNCINFMFREKSR